MNRRFVYTIKRPGDKKPSGLALNCHLWNGAFRYFDMERGHEIPGKVTKDGENAFTFTSEGYEPGEWQFEKLTIERFRRETYKIVEGGNYIAQAIHTTDDLHEWYRRKYGEEAGLCYPRVGKE